MTDKEKLEIFNERIGVVSCANFDNIATLFKTNNWKWRSLHRNGKWVCDVPDASEIRNTFNGLVNDLRNMIKHGGFPNELTGVSTGRLNLEVDCDGWVDFSIDVHP